MLISRILPSSMLAIFKSEHFHFLPFLLFIGNGPLPSTALDVISPKISRKAKIFTSNDPILTLELGERRFLTSRQANEKNLDQVIYDQNVFMDG